MATRTILLICFFIFSVMAGMAQEVIPLYSGKIPNSMSATTKKKAAKTGDNAALKSSVPTLTAYLPPKDVASGAAVIICPGGGYQGLVMKREGHDVAAEFIKMGVAAFVLEYRLPNDATMQDKTIGPLQDAQQAIKLVRQGAKEWNISPDKIGILGFSAGGHLAATAGTQFNREVIDNKEGVSLRPDFMILVYPVISFNDSIGHRGSREHLLGTSPSPEQVKQYSNELQVTPQTPPAFLIHPGNDRKVPVANSLRFFEALNKNGVPAELHIYPKGDHGFAEGAPKDNWLERCRNWMKSNGWIE